MAIVKKLFWYELRRLMGNKFFLGLLLVSAFFSFWVMEGEIILGVANTAPFSPWSFGAYMAKSLPVPVIALLFFISFLYSKQEQAVKVLTVATPIRPLRLRLLRYGAIGVSFLTIFLVPLGYAVWFYGTTFHFADFGSLISPLLFTLLPVLFFFWGLGLLAGRLQPALVFALMPAALLLTLLPLPAAWDLYGTAFFTGYPQTLSVLDPAFSVPLPVVLGRCAYSLAGAGMLAAATALPDHTCGQRSRNMVR